MLLRKLLIIIRAVVIVILCLILIINVYIITAQIVFKNDLPKTFGFAQIVVISGSMQPTIEVGDLLIIKEQKSYDINDIVTYRWGKSLVTHRVVGIIAADDPEYITKGDSNNAADEPIRMSDIEGKVVTRIHGFGNIIFFLRTPAGILSLTFIVFIFIEISLAVERLKQLKK